MPHTATANRKARDKIRQQRRKAAATKAAAQPGKSRPKGTPKGSPLEVDLKGKSKQERAKISKGSGKIGRELELTPEEIAERRARQNNIDIKEAGEEDLAALERGEISKTSKGTGKLKDPNRIQTDLPQPSTGDKISRGLDRFSEATVGRLPEALQPTTQDETPIRGGPVPFTLGGGAITGGISKLLSIEKDVIGNINLFPATDDALALAGKAIPTVKILGKSTKFKILAGIVGTVFGVDRFILSPNELAVWTAVDNIGSAIPFQLNDIEKAVRNNDIEQDVAITLLDQADAHLKNAKNFINTSTAANPKLWAARNRLMEANEVAQSATDRKRENIEAAFESDLSQFREERR